MEIFYIDILSDDIIYPGLEEMFFPQEGSQNFHNSFTYKKGKFPFSC